MCIRDRTTFKWTWKMNGSLAYGDCGATASEQILALDMDDTLISTKSGKKFATGPTDWVFWHESVPKKLKEFHDKGFKVVIISNQGGITKGHTRQADIQKKIEGITEKLGFSIQAMFATDSDHYRKPCTGMWDFLVKNLNDKKTVDISKSYYLGDAAGREAGGGRKKKDHSDTDYKFALNVGLIFQTPEEFFLGAKETLPTFAFDPRKLKKTGSVFRGETTQGAIASTSKEMIIFVGPPGGGKSTFYKTHLKSYVHVNNDTLKKKEKCFQVAREAMAAGKSVVIDNTNPEKVTRADYIKMAKENNYPVRCFFFDIPKDLSFHLNALRKVNAHRKHSSDSVADVIIHTWYKKKQDPEKDEGFTEVKVIETIGGPFESPEEEKLFYSFVD
eukprot:TRINITY_DN4600_c0_g1_i2.p1 TRINITY_DN4600_c0_g1~~TRINITY_DN4600_c0_g1_i2.p1  ORF type:complete len:404 (-),score=129.89 TRINITY_DN4600_c0_g1_i2:255-1418(-)